MAVTVAGKNYTQISSCETTSSGGSWAGVDTPDPTNFKEGSNSLTGTLKANGANDATFTPTSPIDLSGGEHLRIWYLNTSGGLINLKASGGIQMFIGDGTNTGYWFLEGRDTYSGGWINLVVNTANPVDDGTKPTAMNAITTIGVRHNQTLGKNVDNVWVDNLCVADGLIAYGDIDSGTITCTVAASAGTFTRSAGDFEADGFRIGQSFTSTGFTNGGNNTTKTISTVATTVITVSDNTGLVDETGDGDERIRGHFDFEDVYDGDAATTLGIGVIRKIGGQYFSTGSLEIGDGTASSTNITKFQPKSQVVVFENRPVNSNLYNITAVDGGGTGTTEFILGSKSGTAGIEGCLIRVAETTQTPKYDIDGSTDTDISDFKLYGSTFLDADSISLPPDATNIEVINCSFESCGEVLADTCDVTYCNFVSSNDRGVRMSSTSHNITNSNFISCTHGIHIPTANTYTFNNLVFTACTYDIENSGNSAAVVVNATGTSNPSSAENTGAPAGTTTINNAKTLEITVTDETTTPIEGAQVWIQKSSSETLEYGHPTNPYTDPGASTNQQGDLTYVITETIEGDNPASGWLMVKDNTNNREQSYRYASRTGPTFTLNTKVSGACEAGGSSTLLNDTGISASVVEGDTIRNETDGGWALALSVSANSVTTTPLQGGTSDDWATSDTWSIHSLSQNYTTGDTVTVPIMNEETNASGIATESYNFGASMAVDVRIRHTSGATKYFPYKTTGSITGDFDLTAVLIEDTIAT